MAKRLSPLFHGLIIFGVGSLLFTLQYQFESSTDVRPNSGTQLRRLSTWTQATTPVSHHHELPTVPGLFLEPASSSSAIATTPQKPTTPPALTTTTAAPVPTTPSATERDMHSDNHELLLQRMKRQIAVDPVDELLAAQAAAQQRYLDDGEPIGTRRDKAMIVLCTVRVTCYGLGDRFFGLMANYLSAVIGGRAFFVRHNKPADLNVHMTSGDVDWHVESVKREDVRLALVRHDPCDGKECARHVIELPGVRGQHVLDAARLVAPIVQCWGNARTDVFHEAMHEAKLFPRLKDGATPWTEAERQFWSAHTSSRLWNRLFRFTDALRTAADNLLSAAFPAAPYDFRSLMRCTPCMHVRTGYGLHEVSRHSNRDDFRTCMDKVARDVQASTDSRCGRYRGSNGSHPNNWIVLSDSNMFVDNLKEQLKGSGTIFSTSGAGPLVHAETIALGSDAAVTGLKRAMLDFYLLSHCRYHVASLSTFDGTASIVHGAEVRRYDMETFAPCKDKPNNIGVWQRDVHARH